MSKKRILIVEDEFIVSLNLERKLNLLGYEVVGKFSTGEEAIDGVAEAKPDLILMDIMLGGKIDGIEAAAILKKQVDCPIIFTTAFSSEEFQKRAQLVEPFAYILKPYDQRELSINISIALYKHGVEKKLSKKNKQLEELNQNLELLVQSRTEELLKTNFELKEEIEGRILAQKREKQLAQVIEKADDLIMLFNLEGLIEYVNPQVLTKTNYTEDELIGKNRRVLCSDQHTEKFYKKVDAKLYSGKSFFGEVIRLKKNGEQFIEQVTIVPLYDSNNNLERFASIGRDITELRALEKKQISYAENEKMRVSKELHDSIGQSITAVKFALTTLAKKQTNENEVAYVQHIITQMDDLTKELRAISFNLLPSVLRDYGLIPAIKQIVSNLESSGLNIELDAELNKRMSEEKELGIYRVIQESLNNALKHANATKISIHLSENKQGEFYLHVADNGTGFTLYYEKNKGQGLYNIQQRARVLGGELTISSSLNKGTKITLIVP